MNKVLILIPGLNDQKVLFKFFYAGIEKYWRSRGLYTVLVPMRWESSETIAQKYARVEGCIRQQREEGREVVVVGISAGASLAVGLFGSSEHVIGVVSIVGFLKRAEVAEKWINQTWYQSGERCERVLQHLSAVQKKRILAFYPKEDAIIDPSRARLNGGRNVLVPVRGHLRSIVFTLLWRIPTIKRFIANLANTPSRHGDYK